MYENRNKRLSPWIWIGSFLLFFLITIPLYFIFFTNHQAVIPAEPIIQKDTLAINKPELIISSDSTVFEQTEIKPAAEDSLFTHPRKELYYTIGGSFKSQQNAKVYLNRMTQKGFHPIHLGLIGNFYLVALDTFYTEKEASEAADQYVRIYRNTDIWIYHPK